MNTIRIYNLDPTLDHNLCASIFNAVGIYLILDVNSPLDGESISRANPSGTYTSDYLKRVFGIVEAFKNFPNTLAFFGANEIINDATNVNSTPPYIRAVQRDLNNYIAKHSTRNIPVGYSAADVREVLASTWEYLQCAINGDSSDLTRSSFFGLNSYSWCGDSSYTTSGYDQLIDQFKNTSIPVFFSEYGCNKPAPRIFTEVPVLYGPLMTPVLSGGLVYEYSNEVSNFGLVSLGDNGAVTLRTDYDNLRAQYAKLNTSLLETADPSPQSNPPPKCDSSLITAAGFSTDFDIPSIPDGGQDLIDKGISNPNQGSLVSVTATAVTQAVTDSKGNAVTGLVIKPLPSDQSNTPGGNNTSGAPPKKKSAAARSVEVQIWGVGVLAVLGAVVML